MSVPFQYTSRHESLGGSLGPAIMFTLVFGLTGVYVNLPPLRPPGSNPSGPNKWKCCPDCGSAVRPGPDGYCVCKYCRAEFEASDAADY